MRIKKCRICGNKKLVKIGSLGNIAISTFTDRPKSGRKYPLELVYCPNCTLLQMAHNINRNLLYKDYWYQSHINPIIVNDLKEIAKQVKGSVHIDIAGNDGTLLNFSKARIKISVDPSNIKPEGDIVWLSDYWENVTTIEADTITAIACIYDLPTPNKFIRNVKNHLRSDGIFIAQAMTLKPFVENNDVGNICHEHLLYFSYKSLVRLYEQNGLEVYKVEENGINGGSYRVFARHYSKGSIDFKEKKYGIRELKAFFKRVEENKLKMIKFLKTHDVVGYGASTKANTILQYYKVKLPFIVDVNPLKTSKFTIATKIPVIDFIPEGTQYLWVFPYGFMKYFKNKEKGYKGKWITTIPKFKTYQ